MSEHPLTNAEKARLLFELFGVALIISFVWEHQFIFIRNATDTKPVFTMEPCYGPKGAKP